jgi:hypothetical protein
MDRTEEVTHMRKFPLLTAVLAAAVLIAVPVTLVAHTGTGGSALDRQAFKFREQQTTTSSTAWSNIPGLARFQICAVNEVSAHVNLVLRGAPAAIRIRIDGTDEVIAHPGPVTFRPSRGSVFSFAFADHVAPFEANDFHLLEVQWRSPTGSPVTLRRGMVNVLFERGSMGPACTP